VAAKKCFETSFTGTERQIDSNETRFNLTYLIIIDLQSNLVTKLPTLPRLNYLNHNLFNPSSN